VVNDKYLFAVKKGECRSQRYFIFKVDQVYTSQGLNFTSFRQKDPMLY